MAIKAIESAKSTTVSRKTSGSNGRCGASHTAAHSSAQSSAHLSQLIQSPVSQAVQAKLNIGASNDVHEQEADRVADNVVNLSNLRSQTTANDNATNVNADATKVTPSATTATVAPISIQSKTQTPQAQEEKESETDNGAGFMELSPLLPGDDVQRKADTGGSAEASASFESTLNSSKGGGSPLPDGTRSEMENGIGANFGNVRIHTDSQAAYMSQSIQAKAFTHGNDIYFNQGQYNPESTGGKHLLAHELTHTVQQGAAVQTKNQNAPTPGISQVQTKKIQRGWLGDAWDSVSGAVSGAVEWAADQLDRALDWAKEKFAAFVQKIPGYKLLSVVLGQDPVTGAVVLRNGRNFIAAGLDIIPFGSHYQRKLEESGAMDEAAQWLDKKIANLDVSLSAILASFGRFWRSLSVSDLSDVGGVLNRAANIVRGPVSRIISFAKSIASKLLEIVKKFVLIPLANFVKDNTRGYPLLRVLLGKDPISGEPVPRTGLNLITGFMMLSESGEEQLRQMRESGALQKAAAWIDGAVVRLNITWEVIKQMFSRAWDLVSITSLLNPIGTFRQLANIFLPPVGRIVRFVVEVSIKVLQLIKDALISRLVSYARKVRGYPLLTVLLGKDPFSQNPVLRTTAKIIKGFMSLMEGGLQQFEQMKQTGVIGRLSSKVEKAIATLNITWAYIRGLFTKAWNGFSLRDLAAPIQAFARIIEIFAAPIGRILRFVWEILKVVIEVMLLMMSFPIDLIGQIIRRAMQAIGDIKRDPIGFIKNLMKAVKKGFMQFFDNIGKHLLNGLTGWLFRELKDAGIQPPADLSLKSVLSLVMQVLGITVERIWQKLAEKIGQDKVDKIRGAIDKLTGIWTFVRDVMTRGPIAIWEYIKEKISNLWSTVMDAIRNWIVTRIIQKVTTKLLSMLDPTGIMAVINGFIAFYNAVQSFIQYLREMLEIVGRFVFGVAEIAKGNISQAANFLENALAKGIPIAIGFLANQVGLSGLGKRIGEMIEKVRNVVDKALGWLVDKAVKMGTGFLNMLKSGAAKLGDMLGIRKKFKSRKGKDHSLFFNKVGGRMTLMVASGNPAPAKNKLNAHTPQEPDVGVKQQAKSTALKKVGEAEQQAQQAETPSQTSPQDGTAKVTQSLDNIPADINTSGVPIDEEDKTYTKTEIKYGGLTKFTFNGVSGDVGTKVESTLVRSDPKQGSDTASSDAFSTLFDKLQSSTKTSWVRGHLLNHDLGGVASYNNLFPITTSANGEHKYEVESPIKKLFHTKYKGEWRNPAIKYNVTASKTDGSNNQSADGKFACYAEVLQGEDKGQVIHKTIHSRTEAGDLTRQYAASGGTVENRDASSKRHSFIEYHEKNQTYRNQERQGTRNFSDWEHRSGNVSDSQEIKEREQLL